MSVSYSIEALDDGKAVSEETDAPLVNTARDQDRCDKP